MNRILLFGMFLVFHFSFSQEKIPFIDYESIIEEASVKRKDGDFKGVIESFNKISKNDSTYTTVLAERVYYHLQLKEYDKVVALCDEGLDRNQDTNESSFYINKAVAYINTEQYEKALHVIEEGLLLYPKSQKLWFNKAYVNQELGMIQEAVTLYQETILLNPYYTRPHLMLGNLCFKQQKMAQALMCFNMYIMLEPDADNSNTTLNELNNIAVAKNVNVPDDNVEISTDDSAFEEIDLILNQKVALSDSYDIGNEMNIGLMKQSHALFTQLLEFEGNGGFWSRKYVPFYQWVMSESHFNDYAYTLAYSIENEELQKIVSKKTDEIVAFLDLARNKWTEILQENKITVDGKETEQTNYYDGTYLRGVGEFLDDKLIGPWKFYNSNGKITANGVFDDEGNRHGKWTWYYAQDKVKELAIYNHGKLEGAYLTYHENGKKNVVAEYKNDLLDGEYKLYNKKGALEQKKFYKEGKLEGVFKSYFNVGEDHLEYDVNYKNDKVEGIVKEYHLTGQLYAETSYRENVKDGPEKKYNSDGTLILDSHYVNGLLEGSYKSYHSNGNPSEVGQTIAGSYEGSWVSYFPNGNLSEEYGYEKGKLQGLGKYYSKDGQLHIEYTYRKGEIIAYKIFDKDGNIQNEAKKKGGEFIYKGYSIDGHLTSEGLYDISGGKIGTWKFYDENGAIKSEGFYEENELQGTYTTYFNNGKIQSRSKYEKGIVDGYYVDYYINGTMRTQGWYRDNEAFGEWRSYYKDSTLLSINFYHQGLYNGEQTNYAVDGSIDQISIYKFGDLVKEVIYDPKGSVFEVIDHKESTGKRLYHHFNKKPKTEISYKNGIKHGNYSRFSYYGIKTVEGTYLGGNQEGQWKWYHDDGSLESEVDFHIDQYNGKTNSYYENGAIEDEYVYKYNNPEGTWHSYFEDGTLMISSEWQNGEYHGEIKFYSPKGKLQIVEFYEYGKIIGYTYHDKNGKEIPMIPLENETGKVVSYYDNGQIAREYEYKNENLIGKYTSYHYDGTFQNVRNFVADEREGLSTYYYPNGSIKRETEYLNGSKHGIEKCYYENKQIKEEIQYLNGSKHGAAVYYNEVGNMVKKELYFNGNIYEAEHF